MEHKVIDPELTVYELCAKDGQIQALLAQAGFKDILIPGMLNTAGRFMTLSKGMKLKGIDRDSIQQIFVKQGYVLKEAKR